MNRLHSFHKTVFCFSKDVFVSKLEMFKANNVIVTSLAKEVMFLVVLVYQGGNERQTLD